MADPDRIRALVAQHGSPLLLLSPRTIAAQYRALAAALPGVELHFALRPLPHPAAVRAIADEGGGFDLASPAEVALAQACGVDPARCLHTHPVKRSEDIAAAHAFGCRTFVYDSPYELAKFLPWRDAVDLLVRVSFQRHSAKFGAAPDEVLPLLRAARGMGLRCRGLGFHVGTQMLNAFRYIEALAACRRLFDQAAGEGFALDTLDIGGGYPVPYLDQVMPIAHYCHPIAAELGRLFPGVRVLAEPGRFVSAPAMTLVATVIGKAERHGRMWYYLDDGLHGSFAGRLHDGSDHPLTPLVRPPGPDRLSVVAGPTGDAADIVHHDIMLPELACGDLVIVPMMGAYAWTPAAGARIVEVES